MLQVVSKIREYQKDNNLSGEQLRLEIIDKKFVKLIGDDKKAYDLLLQVSKSDKEYIDLLCDMIPQFKSKRDAFSDSRPGGYNTLVDGLDKILSEGVSQNIDKGDVSYIYALRDKGYMLVSSKDEIGYVSEIPELMIETVRKTYTPRPIAGFSDDCILKLRSVITSVGLDPKRVDIWSKSVYKKHEDLAFRLFLKETESSYDFLLKIPKGMSATSFDLNKDGVPNKNLEALPGCFSDDGSYTKAPAMIAFSSAFGINTPYLAIRFNIVKDYIAFKKENWLLRDYIKTARGKMKSKYNELGDLPLGKSLMVGVYPGGYLDWEINCEAGVSACLMSGGAGSGKTVMFDSILLQSLAYEGDFGDGAVALLDFKQEWVAAWKKYFTERDVPFYGFDGEPLPADRLLYEFTDKKGTEIKELPYVMPNYLAGALFLNGMYVFIQRLLRYDKDNPSSNIHDYNTSGKNSRGIAKIPRLTVLSDEINSMYDRISKRKEYISIYKNCMLQAKATRTSGYIWFFAGQDISHTIIPKAEKNNYLYRIGGSLPTARYVYHELTPNPSIKAYAELHGTEKVPDPIMRQGMFYAGQAEGISTVTKCMFLPSEERGNALDDLESKIPGMHQFHALVKLALEDGVFDDTTVESLGYKNNIVYCALWQLGIITEEEFDYYTKRCFGTADDSSNDSEDEFVYDTSVSAKNISDINPISETTDELNSQEYEDDIYDDVDVEAYYKSREEMYGGVITDDTIEEDSMGDSVIDDVNSGVVDDYYKKREQLYDDNIEDDVEDVNNSSLGARVIQFPNKGVTEDYQEDGNLAPQSDYVDGVEVSDVGVVEDIPAETNIEQSNPNPSNVIQGGWESPKSIEDIPKNDPVYTEPVKSPNTFMGCQVYEEELDLGTFNPFDARSSKTIFGGIDAFRYMNKVVEKEIKKAYHGLDRINTIHVSDNGLFINDIAFRPFVPKVVVDSLPIDIRGEVARGNIIEFFDFQMLFRLPNLDTLVIDNVRLAETKVRRELRMKRDMTWDLLYDNFDSLRLLEIGGSRITTPEEAAKYTDTSGGDYEFQEKIREAFKFDSDILERVKSPVQKLWRSRPVAIVTGALGGTVGTKVVLGMASMMGAWGILFAGLAGYGAYNTYIKGNGRNSSRGYSGSSYESYDYDDYVESKPQKNNKKSNRRR